MFVSFARPFGVAVSLAIAAFACHSGSSSSAATSPALVAHATLLDQAGARVGSAVLREDRDGAVHLDVNVTGMTPGPHGLHIHTVGSCSGTAFGDAGGHFNPSAAHHGLSNAAGPHAGDLPNIDVLSNGVGRFQGVTTRVTLRPSSTSVLDADGSALVVHAAADDQLTDPAGNSGARVACGVIVRGA
jgi:Cu-Zn family superoxide dismutase